MIVIIFSKVNLIFPFSFFLKQAGRGRGVVARGRAGGPPARGAAANRAGRGGAAGVRGSARPVARGAARGKGSLPGKFS